MIKLTTQQWLTVIIISYFIGSIPFSYIIPKFFGKIDIRKYGSGNVGSTNIARTLGTKIALIAFVLDILKGMIPSLIGWSIAGQDVAYICGTIAIFGHCFPIWLQFKGGKGVATTTGVILVSSPYLFIYIAVIQISGIIFTKYMSLAAIISAFALPILSFILSMSTTFTITSLIISGLVIIRHHTNIKRLLSGNESKFTLKFNKK